MKKLLKKHLYHLNELDGFFKILLIKIELQLLMNMPIISNKLESDEKEAKEEKKE